MALFVVGMVLFATTAEAQSRQPPSSSPETPSPETPEPTHFDQPPPRALDVAPAPRTDIYVVGGMTSLVRGFQRVFFNSGRVDIVYEPAPIGEGFGASWNPRDAIRTMVGETDAPLVWDDRQEGTRPALEFVAEPRNARPGVVSLQTPSGYLAGDALQLAICEAGVAYYGYGTCDEGGTSGGGLAARVRNPQPGP